MDSRGLIRLDVSGWVKLVLDQIQGRERVLNRNPVTGCAIRSIAHDLDERVDGAIHRLGDVEPAAEAVLELLLKLGDGFCRRFGPVNSR